MSRRGLVAVAVAGIACVAAAGCAGNGTAGPATTKQDGDRLSAEVASYDLAAGREQRVIIGLLTGDNRLVSFGSARFSFAYLGTEGRPLERPRPGPSADATWQPVPGQRLPTPLPSAPRLVTGSKGVGVYGAAAVRFDQAGQWQVTVVVTVAGREERVLAVFDVADQPKVVAQGQPAPRSENYLPGAPGVPPTAVDSRAESSGAVPDQELHAMTVADAVANGRPTMVVVSTPVFCESRFCGPITDSVGALAQTNSDRMNFVHIEVWRDYEKKQVNRAAADWIFPPGAQDAQEPWVFLIGRDGTVQQRWDNVVTDAQLEATVQEAVA